MKQATPNFRSIDHADHTDIERLFTIFNKDGGFSQVWAVVWCGQMKQEQTMSKFLCTRVINANPNSYTVADIVSNGAVLPHSVQVDEYIKILLEQIADLKAEVANANEGARLMHSVAMQGEQSALSHIDNHVDTVDEVAWKDETDVSQYFNGITAHASKTWRERHLNQGG
jgi:hypothetical protein